jgi:hypothetical protein
MDTGVVATVTDSFLLATLLPEDIPARVRNFANRVAGAILLAVTIWLWPVVLIAAVAENPRRPIRSRLLLGNPKHEKTLEFRAFEFAVSIPTLRYLPYLFPVVAGHLMLIGAKPLESRLSTAPSQGLDMVRNKVCAGLSGLIRSTKDAEMVKRRPKLPQTNLQRPLAE